MRRLFYSLLFIFYLCVSIRPGLSESVIEIEDIKALLLDWRTSFQERLGEEIFDAIGTQNISIELNDHVSVSGKVKRRFFENRDGSYTILDVMDVRGHVVFAIPVIDQIGLDFSIGAEKGYRFAHTYLVDNRKKLETYEKWKEKRGNESILESIAHTVSPSNWFGVRSLFEGFGHLLDEIAIFLGVLDRDRARFSGMWKAITQPLDIPLSASYMINHIDLNEMYSFTSYKGIFTNLGVSAPGGFSHGISAGAHARGDHRITVLKSGPTTAKIKVQKIFSKTRSKSAGGKIKLFEYRLSIFGFDPKVKLAKKPYDLTLAFTESGPVPGEAFTDQAYEYDLSTEEGREAYELALQGDFITSNLRAEDENGVKKLFSNMTHSFINRVRSSFDLLVYKQVNDSEVSEHWNHYVDEKDTLDWLQTTTHNSQTLGNIITSKDELDFTVNGRVILGGHGFGMHPQLIAQLIWYSDKTTLGYDLKEMLGLLPHDVIYRHYRDLIYPWPDYGNIRVHYRAKFSEEALYYIAQAPNELIQQVYDVIFKQELEEVRKPLKETTYVEWERGDKGPDILKQKRIYDLKKGLRDIKKRLFRLKDEPNVQSRMISLSHAFSHKYFSTKLLYALVVLGQSHNSSVFQEFIMRGKQIPEILETRGDDIPEDRYEEMARKLSEYDDGRYNLERPQTKEALLSKVDASSPLYLKFKPSVDVQKIKKIYLKVSPDEDWADIDALYESNRRDGLLSHDNFTVEEDVITLNLWQDFIHLQNDFKPGKEYVLTLGFLTDDGYWSSNFQLHFTFQDTMLPK